VQLRELARLSCIWRKTLLPELARPSYFENHI
jgi:hypothetical protein